MVLKMRRNSGFRRKVRISLATSDFGQSLPERVRSWPPPVKTGASWRANSIALSLVLDVRGSLASLLTCVRPLT